MWNNMRSGESCLFPPIWQARLWLFFEANTPTLATGSNRKHLPDHALPRRQRIVLALCQWRDIWPKSNRAESKRRYRPTACKFHHPVALLREAPAAALKRSTWPSSSHKSIPQVPIKVRGTRFPDPPHEITEVPRVVSSHLAVTAKNRTDSNLGDLILPPLSEKNHSVNDVL